MKFILPSLLLVITVSATSSGQANVHPNSVEYQWPTDPVVHEKLEKWRDQKFGIIIHWGLYAVPGIIESWELCSESWINRDSTISYDDYKNWYWGLKKQFNPISFDPDQWAKAASDAGMRYVVFTTKHHDGFAMFDTKESDFKISGGPFAKNPKADVAKYVFDSFRREKFLIGAYFSKPDWHSEYFWWPRYATPDRNVNYDIRKNPWRWEQFKKFTHRQIGELMRSYGSIDILWLDGGWVRPLSSVTQEVRNWGAAIPEWSQDIDMDTVASVSRKLQPGILIVDRTVHGQYENYQTPEQKIPEGKLDIPWESCVTLGNAWGYVPNDQLKESSQVIRLLIEIVAKGGNLLLGVGPDPNGKFNENQIKRLKEIGDWLKANGESIYNTRPTEVFQDGKTFFTQSKNGKQIFAIVTLDKKDALQLQVSWRGNVPAKKGKMRLLSTGEDVKWFVRGDSVVVTFPKSLQKEAKRLSAVAFSYAR